MKQSLFKRSKNARKPEDILAMIRTASPFRIYEPVICLTDTHLVTVYPDGRLTMVPNAKEQ